MQPTAQRIVTAVIALSVFLSALFYLPNDLFKIFMAAIALGLCYEWFGVVAPSKRIVGMVATLILIAGAYFYPQFANGLIVVAALVWLVLFAGLIPSLELPPIANSLAGPIVISATWSAVSIAQGMGAATVLHLLLFVWLADSSAYFCGRAFGKTKLAPKISPGKTREGVLGALIITVLVNYLVAKYFSISPWNQGLVAFFGGALLVFISVLGDLYQSQQKRRAGVKDSGTFLPGHGGFWDRLDSLLPVSVFYILISQSM